MRGGEELLLAQAEEAASKNGNHRKTFWKDSLWANLAKLSKKSNVEKRTRATMNQRKILGQNRTKIMPKNALWGYLKKRDREIKE